MGRWYHVGLRRPQVWHCVMVEYLPQAWKDNLDQKGRKHSVNVFWWGQHPRLRHWARASSFTRFLDHTIRHTTVGWTTLDEGSARRRDLYLKTRNTQQQADIYASRWYMNPQNQQASGRRPHALDRAATGTGHTLLLLI